MEKQYIIITHDAVGYWAIEGVYDDFENAKSDLLKNIEELNENIIALNIQKENECGISYFTTKFEHNEIYKESRPNVMLSYSNRSFTIDILEIEKNKFLKSIHSWYEPDEDME